MPDTGTMTEIIPLLLPGVVGAFTGAAAGGLVAMWLAPTRAEREEWGRSRVEARAAIEKAAGLFHYKVSEAQHRALNMNPVPWNELEAEAIAFASALYWNKGNLRRWSKRRLKKAARRIVGDRIWRIAQLRPSSEMHTPNDSAVYAAIRSERHDDNSALLNHGLLADPLDPKWAALLTALAKLQQQRY